MYQNVAIIILVLKLNIKLIQNIVDGQRWTTMGCYLQSSYHHFFYIYCNEWECFMGVYAYNIKRKM